MQKYMRVYVFHVSVYVSYGKNKTAWQNIKEYIGCRWLNKHSDPMGSVTIRGLSIKFVGMPG